MNLNQVCDGIFDCNNGYDELYCNTSFHCPPMCNCSEPYRINCHNINFNTQILLKSNILIKILFLLNTKNSDDFLREIKEKSLVYLNMSTSTWKQTSLIFEFSYLVILDLSYTFIHKMQSSFFEKLTVLKQLYLRKTKIKTIHDNSFGVSNLIYLDLSFNHLHEIRNFAFKEMKKLKKIIITNSYIDEIHKNAFTDADSLQQLNFNKSVFSKRIVFTFLKNCKNLKEIFSNQFSICCSSKKYVKNVDCIPQIEKTNGLCSDILKYFYFRAFCWILTFILFFGNLLSIFLKIRKYSKSIHSILILLCLSDFMTSVYLLIVLIADRYFQNIYIDYHVYWTGSFLCKLGGFLKSFGITTSPFCTLIITLDRFYSIKYLLNKKNINYLIITFFMIIGSLLFNLFPLLIFDVLLFFCVFKVGMMIFCCFSLIFQNYLNHKRTCSACISNRQKFHGFIYSFILNTLLIFLLYISVGITYFFLVIEIFKGKEQVKSKESTKFQKIIAVNSIIISLLNILVWLPMLYFGM